MKYIVIPTSAIEALPQETLDEFNLVPRYNIYKTKILMKTENYDLLYPPILPMVEDDMPVEITYPYPTYEYGTQEFKDLLENPEWFSSEGRV